MLKVRFHDTQPDGRLIVILVVGGSGDLGSRVVRRLHAAGREVRCLVRPATNVEWMRALGVATATAVGRVLGGAKKPGIREVDQIGMSALVEAAGAAGVERFVHVSYAGVDAGLNMPRCANEASTLARPAPGSRSRLASPAREQLRDRRLDVHTQ